MAWASGQRLQGGKYTIQQELGQGGFGITYRVINDDGRLFVIKTLNDNVQRRSDFARFQQDFLNEALRLAKCSHPHIVRIDQVIQEGALWGIVMEYIDGEDLASRVENQGALPESEALHYIQQIGEALTVVHKNGLLHRDVKPTNIMLRPGNSEAVLIDFGTAREFIPNLTQTHTQFLSDGFAPIEQYDKRAKRGAYTDVYALAATLYCLLTAEVPTLAPLRAIGTPLEPPKQINLSISDRVNQAIIKGMEVKAENRPQSVQEWLALMGIGVSSTIPSSPQSIAMIPTALSPNYQSPLQVPSISLISAVDYSKLLNLLAKGEWEAADRETWRLMLRICRREKEGWLRKEDVNDLLCTDLGTINHLWIKFGNGRFGFSIQNRIWQEVGQDLDKFFERVGWHVGRDRLNLPQLTYYEIFAPVGHLPGVWNWLREAEIGWQGLIRDLLGFHTLVSLPALLSRFETCNL